MQSQPSSDEPLFAAVVFASQIFQSWHWCHHLLKILPKVWLMHFKWYAMHHRCSNSLPEAPKGIAKGSHHASARNKISAAFYTFGKPSLSTQLDVYSPSPVNLPVSKCYTSASCLAWMSLPKHNCYLRAKVRTLQLSFLAVFHNPTYSYSMVVFPTLWGAALFGQNYQNVRWE